MGKTKKSSTPQSQDPEIITEQTTSEESAPQDPIPPADQNEANAAEQTAEPAAPDALERIQQELDAQKDLLLRTAAEFDNYKKRTARETERIGMETRAAVLKELLPAVDNFLRAQDNTQAAQADYQKGIELCIKQFNDILTKLGLEEIDALGTQFDPNLHYAVSQTQDENAGENEVVQVLQKGYRMGDIILRPAMVAVANC